RNRRIARSAGNRVPGRRARPVAHDAASHVPGRRPPACGAHPDAGARGLWQHAARSCAWLAIPMFALWANLHGGFFIGLIALGLYAAIRGAQDLAAARSASTAARLVAISAAAALATLVNPYGLRDWLVIAGVLRNPFTLAHISEFRPLFVVIADLYRHGRPLFPFACAVLIMTAVLVSFALTPRADDLALFAIAALMSAAALYAVRNTALA